MLLELWNTLLIEPLLNLLVFFYQYTGSLGIAIILLTVVMRVIFIPVVLPSMRTMQKQKELQPELDKLKKKYRNDKKKQAEAQMELFKEHGLNPAAGCLSQIPMFVVLIALFGVIQRLALVEHAFEINAILYFESLKFTVDTINTQFLYLDLAQPDPYYVLAISAGIVQFFVSKMSMGFTKKAEKIAKKTPDKSDDLAYNIQEQMLYIMPVVTVIIGLTLPSGVVLYILVTTVFYLIQTYFVFSYGKTSKIVEDIKS